MGLGILEDRVLDHVPGTTRYFDDPLRPQESRNPSNLKCDTSGPFPIILVPQPSNDPNDPLNWPLWKRDVTLAVLSVTSIFATALGPILAANTLTLSFDYEIPFTGIALLTGYFLMGAGFAATFFVPSARIFGKRHLFLLGTIVLVGSSAWAGASSGSYRSLLWARIIQGVATAPFEALVNATVGDLYFVHQRGVRMATTNLSAFGAAFFTPILVGKITHTIGWQWTYYLEAIFFGVCLPAVIFLVPETAYARAAHLNTDLTSSDDAVTQQSNEVPSDHKRIHRSPFPDEQAGGQDVESNQQEMRVSTAVRPLYTAVPLAIVPQKRPYLKTLLPFNGRHSKENFGKLLFRPFPLFFHPAILWACVIQGTMIGWTVFIGIILAAVFLGPPLFWTEVETGYAYTGAFIGAVLGFVVAGGLADWSAKWLTRRNGGVYEPEFRILLVIPQLAFGAAGLYGFGVTANDLEHYSHILPIFFFGLEVMGMVIGAVASSLYIVDAHRDIAIEAFTCMIIFKNFFSFGLTFSAYEWLVRGGVIDTFMAISSVQVAVCLLSIPMYILGKRNRSFFHRHDILKICGLY